MSPRLSLTPGRGWRVLRRTTQLLSVLGMLIAPMLGGWQRMERAKLATVEDAGWNLPSALLDVLPAGEAAARAYRFNRVLGGGSAAEYVGLPAMDPLAGALAMIGGGWNLHSALALLLPLSLALVGGRIFCGWLCGFGVLARLMDRLLVFVPFLPRLRMPPSRPLRFVLLGASVVASLLGVHLLLYLSLPYVLLQQSVYAAWLLGGGSVILSVLLGLLTACLLFGPTLYCAGLCPTGAMLGLAGHARVVRLHVIDPPQCGSRCKMCDNACWLQLQPREGDPGPDCDLCGRCVPVCPKTNLRVMIGKRAGASTGAIVALGLAVVATLCPGLAHADGARKPAITLERELRVGNATVAVSLLDVEGTTLHRDWGVGEHGTDVNVHVARGALQAPDEDGLIAGRPFHQGPLTVELRTPGRDAPPPLRFERANHPISAQRPSIYRARVPIQLRPGDSVVVEPVAGYFDVPLEVFVGQVGTRAEVSAHAPYFLLSVLVFSGLLSLALAWRPPKAARGAEAGP